MSLFQRWCSSAPDATTDMANNVANKVDATSTTSFEGLKAQLGTSVIALRLPHASQIPAHCLGINSEHAVVASGATLAAPGYLFAPGPFEITLLPQPDAAELALSLTLVFDSEAQTALSQRFALMLEAEALAVLTVSEMQHRVQASLNQASAQALLQIETCPSAEEWQYYRSALEKIIFTRFGWMLDRCLPQDRGLQCDYADTLFSAANAQQTKLADSELPAASTAVQSSTATPTLAQVCHRLWLELPALGQAWRLLPWPADSSLYLRWQTVAQRLDLLDSILATPPHYLFDQAGSAQAAQAARAQRLHASLEHAWAHLANIASLATTNFAASSEHMAQLENFCQQWEDELGQTAREDLP